MIPFSIHPYLQKFVELFNNGKFFESHELLEDVWKKTTGKEKLFLQSLIQVAVSLHHDKRKNEKGALEEYSLAKKKLEKYPAKVMGIYLHHLLLELENYFKYPIEKRKNFIPRIKIETMLYCMRCGYLIEDMPLGCKSRCPACDFPYPQGSCSD